MKRKRLAVIAIVFVVIIGVGSTLYSKRHTFFLSPQMKELRQLEAHLDLPKPKYRNEEDLGFYKDWKGASHYHRHIALSYEDVSVLNTLKAKLLRDSWQEQAADPIGTNTIFYSRKVLTAPCNAWVAIQNRRTAMVLLCTFLSKRQVSILAIYPLVHKPTFILGRLIRQRVWPDIASA